LRGTALALILLAALTTRSSAGTARSIDLPVILDGREVAQVPAFFGGKNALRSVDGARFAEALRPFLLPETFKDLSGHIDAAGKLTPDAVRASGIEFTFDAARVAVRVGVGASRRPLMPLDLAHLPERSSGRDVPPAFLSGYLNFLGGEEYRRGDPSGAPPGWAPPVFDFDGAVRASSAVLEGVVTHRGENGVPWQRQDFRLVYDRPDDRVRSTLGDVNYGLRGFQSFQRMGGVTAARSLELQRSRSSAPSAATTLLLERNSRVDIWINGQRTQTLQLAPGRYDVRNFPLALGTNDVVLRVTDEVGRVETVSFPFVFDSSLLDLGEKDFSYAAGFLSQVTPQGRSYDVHEPAVSLYRDVGITKQVTMGVNAQGTGRQQMIGAVSRRATRYGTVGVDIAASRMEDSASGAAARMQYRYVDTSAQGKMESWTAVATFRSPTFTALGDTAASNPYALEAGLVYGRRLVWGVLGTLGLGRQLGRAGRPDGATEDLTLSRSFGRGLQATLELSRRYPVVNQTDNRVLLSLEWNFGRVQTVTASEDSATGAARLQWHHSAPQRVRAADSDVIFERDRLSETSQGDILYRDYRFSAQAAGSSEQDRIPGASARQNASLNVGTALAFVDGHAALSRPITDSFVMVAPHPSLAGQPIEVDAVDGIPAARSGRLGPAVLPEVWSYDEHRVEVSAPDLPPWVDLGPQPRYVYPGYRSGTRLVAGAEAAVVVEGLIIDAAGRPLTLEPGDVASLDDPAAAPQAFFTAATGRFAVEGLKPGRLRLVLRNYPDKPVLLTISPGRSGMVDIGTLSLPPFKR
jgi:outer membrane usher protein